MTCLFCSWQILKELEVPAITEAQTVLQVGGPYPETRANWLRLVRDLDPLAARWLDWAFEAHRITPRIHIVQADGQHRCFHPEARLLTRDPLVATCAVCRYVDDIDWVQPVPSVFEMGDVWGLDGPIGVIP